MTKGIKKTGRGDMAAILVLPFLFSLFLFLLSSVYYHQLLRLSLPSFIPFSSLSLPPLHILHILIIYIYIYIRMCVCSIRVCDLRTHLVQYIQVSFPGCFLVVRVYPKKEHGNIVPSKTFPFFFFQHLTKEF